MGDVTTLLQNSSISHLSEAEMRCPIYESPLPSALHFLLKIHALEDYSGQCVVKIDRDSFDKNYILEFQQHCSRDGVPLLHPVTKTPIQVHFVVQVSKGIQSATSANNITQATSSK
jgi:hypothetical protein